MPLTNSTTIPIPEKEIIIEDKRLWIGNLDPRITEFQLLKIVQKYGNIEKFDLLYHKTGPLAGQPRGYGFVTFKENSSAEKMMVELDGKKLGNKTVAIKWAHTMAKGEIEKPKTELIIPALGENKELKKKKINRISQIHAIESKLKMMEQLPTEDFQISNIPSTSGCLMNINNQSNRQSNPQKNRNRNYKNYSRHKPYFKK